MRIAYAAVGFVVGASSVGIAWWATSGSEDSRPSGPQITVTGKVTVFGSWVHGQGDEGCVGIDSYADLRNGTPVRVFDLDGHELAQGRLENGTAGEVVGNSCTWPLTVKGVPSGAVQYQVQVGDRDRVTKVREELQAGLTLSYGQQ
ncbi:hypothetical protein [Streptomyces sp. NPDC004721]